MKKTILSISIATAALIAGPSFAQGNSNARAHGHFNVNQRQDNQHDRIVNGVKSGELTRAETQNLREDQRRIHAAEVRMRADGGGLSPVEHARLAQMQNRESQEIARKKHNDRDRDN